MSKQAIASIPEGGKNASLKISIKCQILTIVPTFLSVQCLNFGEILLFAEKLQIPAINLSIPKESPSHIHKRKYLIQVYLLFNFLKLNKELKGVQYQEVVAPQSH